MIIDSIPFLLLVFVPSVTFERHHACTSVRSWYGSIKGFVLKLIFYAFSLKTFPIGWSTSGSKASVNSCAEISKTYVVKTFWVVWENAVLIPCHSFVFLNRGIIHLLLFSFCVRVWWRLVCDVSNSGVVQRVLCIFVLVIRLRPLWARTFSETTRNDVLFIVKRV